MSLYDNVGDISEYILGDETIGQEAYREYILNLIRGQIFGTNSGQSPTNNPNAGTATKQEPTASISLTNILLIGGFALVAVLGVVLLVRK